MVNLNLRITRRNSNSKRTIHLISRWRVFILSANTFSCTSALEWFRHAFYSGGDLYVLGTLFDGLFEFLGKYISRNVIRNEPKIAKRVPIKSSTYSEVDNFRIFEEFKMYHEFRRTLERYLPYALIIITTYTGVG